MVFSLYKRIKGSDLASGISILALTQFLASFVGLVRNSVLNKVFADNLSVVDVYIAAFRPSDLLFQAFIMSAVGTVLVPILASRFAKSDNEGMRNILHATTHVAAITFGILALILAMFFSQIAPLLTEFKGEQLELYISFGRLALLVNFLFVFGNVYGQYLITIQKYWIYGLTPILYTLGTIFGVLFLRGTFGDFAPMAGTIAGALVYVILRFGAILHAGARFQMQIWHPEIPGMIWLMLPRMLSLGALQIQFLFLDRVASGLEKGSIVIASNAQGFSSVVVGVVGIAIAQTVYSVLSQAIAKGDNDRFHEMLRKGTRLCLMLTILGAFVLVLCAPIAARLVHLQDKLSIFTMILIIYSLSIPFESLNHLQLRAFYAMRNTITPTIWGIIGGIVAVCTAMYFESAYGILAVAAGYAASEIVKTTGLYFALPRNIKIKE